MNRVIGNPKGFFGDKFEQLTASSALIESAGAFVPETIGVAQEVIDEALVASGLPTIDEAAGLPANSRHIARVQHDLALPSPTQDALVDAAEHLSSLFDGPLILRSSGRGDAVGVGVYESRLHGVDRESVLTAFTDVAGSYFTEQAVVYRQRRGLASGFSMFMQPVVGQHLKARDEWPHRREDYDDLDMFDREHCTLPVFAPLVSGNVKVGTARSMGGLLRLEEGIGSAVSKRSAPIFELADEKYDDTLLSMVNHDYYGDHIWFRVDDSIGGNHAIKANGSWALSEVGGRHGYLIGMSEQLKLSDLKQVVNTLHEGKGVPCYVEFAVTNVDGQEKIYVIQLGELNPASNDQQSDFEFIDPKDVLADKLQAQNDVLTTQPFEKIVTLGSWEDHDDLYRFDSQAEAQGGYLLVYNSRATHRGSSRIDLRKLKNVVGLLELESLQAGRGNATAEEHLIGYSEQLGIPLLSIGYGADAARRSLMGMGQEQIRNQTLIPEVERFGGLFVRSGLFRIAGDPQSRLTLVAKC